MWKISIFQYKMLYEVSQLLVRCILILLDSLDDAETTSTGGGSSNRWVLFRDSLFLASSAAVATSEATESAESQKAQADVQQMAVAWLSSALSNGQVGRIVAPLFSILLHPSTARTSLLSIHHRRRLLQRIQRRRNRRLRRAKALLNGKFPSLLAFW